jgi:hypothetical protein
MLSSTFFHLLAETTSGGAFAVRHLPWMLATPLVAAVVAALLFRDRLTSRQLQGATWLARVLCAGFLTVNVLLVARNLASPRDWDFKNFWFWSVALNEGTNPYDHDNLLRIAAPLQPSAELQAEMHCVYPPPSLLLFAPLGGMSFYVAHALWTVLQIGVYVACLVMLVRLFRPASDKFSTLALATLFCAYWGTAATLSYLQTNHLVLLGLLLMWRHRERAVAGVWLVLATLAKPVAALVGLYLLVRGKWKGLVATAAAAMVVLGLTWLLLGGELFSQFFTSTGVGEHYKIAQSTNQSLSAVLLRGTGASATAGSLTKQPLVLGSIAAVLLASSAIMLRLRGPADPYAFHLAIATALLTYPATLTHYGVLLLLPLAFLLQQAPPTPRARWGLVLVVAIVFLLSALRLTFGAMLVVWGTTSLMGLMAAARPISSPPGQSSPAMAVGSR